MQINRQFVPCEGTDPFSLFEYEQYDCVIRHHKKDLVLCDVFGARLDLEGVDVDLSLPAHDVFLPVLAQVASRTTFFIVPSDAPDGTFVEDVELEARHQPDISVTAANARRKPKVRLEMRFPALYRRTT